MNMDVRTLSADYTRGGKDLQGTLLEETYDVRNYINSNRQLVTNQAIRSEQAGRETVEGDPISKKCQIYLPARYNEKDPSTKYNVLYLLHGVGGNRYEWLDGNGKGDENYIICHIIDHLIANGEIDPLIVVFPEGRSSYDWTDRSFNSEGTNMLGFYYFDYELRYDLIPFIESNFHTYAKIEDHSLEGLAFNRLHRAIAGLSMGGMQSLNLVLGGFRCDSATYTGNKSVWKNGLDTTVLAPGMGDLFTYVGAFSNAPTSSEGKVLGTSLAACGHNLQLLYITCGSADVVAIQSGYERSISGLLETAGDYIGNYYQVLIQDGVHDFNVWLNGAYNFLRLSFGKREERLQPHAERLTLKFEL